MPEPTSHPTAAGPAVTPESPTQSVADAATATRERSATEFLNVPPPPSGRYVPVEVIARGGMGIIYRATDTALNREVALKVLQERFASDTSAARRFSDEARIAAQLQHPGIPAVHDVGALADGRPFLAMKLIKGRTLEASLASRPEPSAERGRFVAVFEQVCQAIAYAHAHQVIHRDLKPGNIMVGAFGEVQVMDWGLAKVLGDRPADASDPLATTAATLVAPLRDTDARFTAAGSVLGTPAFMPPEQAIGAIDQIDARSDVFGLGGVLAAVLTGRPPFHADTAESTRQLAARGKVQDCFARLEGCGADPELVALCKRCLAPEKADRPADASEVARAVAQLRAAADERARRAELERVQAAADQAAAIARALERRRRRRLWLGAAAALVLAAVGGLTAVLVVQRRANATLAAKNVELAEEQAKVQARFELAQKAIATFHTGVSEDVLLSNDQFKDLRTRLLKEAAGFYGDLEKLLEGQTDAKSRRLLAEGYVQLAGLTEKIGSKPEALAVHRKALALRRELASNAGADVETRLDVARSLRAVGIVLDATGDKGAALAAFQEQRDKAAALEAESPTDATRLILAQGHNSVAIMLSQMGKPGEALASFEKAMLMRQKLAEANPGNTDFQRNLANSHHNIGYLLSQTGKPAEALAAYQKALAIRQKLADGNAAVTGLQSELALGYLNVGNLLWQTGKPEEGLAIIEKALAIRQKLAKANPAVADFQSELANTYNEQGRLLTKMGRFADAFACLEQGQAIMEKLLKANAKVLRYKIILGESHFFRGSAQLKVGRPAEAAAELRQTVALWGELKALNGETRFARARALALLAGLGGDARSAVTATEAAGFADQAAANLRDAVKAGWAEPEELKEPDFDPLRKRDDFRAVVQELEARTAAARSPGADSQPGPAKK